MSSKRHFRLSSRPLVKCNVELKVPSSTNSVFCHTLDIGKGGLYAVTDVELPTDLVVDVCLSIPSTWEPLDLKATVAWNQVPTVDEPGGVGLHFIDLTDSQLVALAGFVETLNFDV